MNKEIIVNSSTSVYKLFTKLSLQTNFKPCNTIDNNSFITVLFYSRGKFSKYSGSGKLFSKGTIEVAT